MFCKLNKEPNKGGLYRVAGSASFLRVIANFSSFLFAIDCSYRRVDIKAYLHYFISLIGFGKIF